MKALVTGGLGFVGSNLVDLLVEKDYQVYVIDDLSSESASLYNSNEKATVSISTVEKSSFMKEEKFDVIFHLAAKARIQPSFSDPVPVVADNFLNVLRVAQKSVEDNSRLIFASTSSSQGGDYISPYTYSKRAAEELLKMYRYNYNLRSSAVRFFNVYGPREPKIGEWPTVIGKFIQQYRKGEALTAVGDGKQSRDFTHVRDICEGLIKISQTEGDFSIGSPLGDINLGRGDSKSIMEVIRMFYDNPIEGKDFIYTPLRKNEPLRTSSNPEDLHALLGWMPQMNLSEYIEKEKLA